jgi:hypothetical protein
MVVILVRNRMTVVSVYDFDNIVMSKEKLISLIIRKQTYKEVKSYLTEILNLNE